MAQGDRMSDDATIFIDLKIPQSLYEKILIKFHDFITENLCEPKTLILSMEYYTWFVHIKSIYNTKCKFFGMTVLQTDKPDTIEVF